MHIRPLCRLILPITPYQPHILKWIATCIFRGVFYLKKLMGIEYLEEKKTLLNKFKGSMLSITLDYYKLTFGSYQLTSLCMKNLIIKQRIPDHKCS